MIEFKQVHKQYPNGLLALKDIDLQIDQGEYVAIIGLSGAGKSTLLRCVNRMHDISSGSLKVDDVEISTLRGKGIRQLRRSIGMIFQSFNLVTRISVMKNVLVSFVPEIPLWRKVLGVFTEQEKKQALIALDRVGILD
ncbi:ATP-binding cassette domain-containing protein, partial [Staphylococcus sp. SIMBA_130]